MVSYAADSHSLYGALYHSAGGKHSQGAILPIYEWDTGRYLTDIPQAGESYSTGRQHERTFSSSSPKTTFGGREELPTRPD